MRKIKKVILTLENNKVLRFTGPGTMYLYDTETKQDVGEPIPCKILELSMLLPVPNEEKTDD